MRAGAPHVLQPGIPELALNRVLLRHADIVGVNVGGFFSVDPGYHRQGAAELARLAERDLIRPLIGHRYPLSGGRDALRELESRRATGKVVLEPHAG